MIEAKNLKRMYGDFTAVNDVSFSIPRGQVVGLLGHNGAGKTTIMKMLTGYLEPTDGQIQVAGLDIAKDRLAVQEKIGYLPENTPVYPEMTVMQYLDYVAKLRSVPESRRPAAIRNAIQKTALESKANAQIATLSKGYRQRVGVAQAILHNPEILILDEPTSGLDPSQIQEMRKLIKQLSETSTVMLSTHILQEVEAMCTRVIIILQGKLALDANLSDLHSSSRLVLNVSQPPNVVSPALQRLNGVKSISHDGNGGGYHRYLLDIGGANGDLTPQVARAVIDHGWDLFDLHHETRSLETVFREINEKGAVGGVNNAN